MIDANLDDGKGIHIVCPTVPSDVDSTRTRSCAMQYYSNKGLGNESTFTINSELCRHSRNQFALRMVGEEKVTDILTLRYLPGMSCQAVRTREHRPRVQFTSDDRLA